MDSEAIMKVLVQGGLDQILLSTIKDLYKKSNGEIA